MSNRLDYGDVVDPKLNDQLKQLSEEFKKTANSIIQSIDNLRKSSGGYSGKVKAQNDIEKKSIKVKRDYFKSVEGLLKQRQKEEQAIGREIKKREEVKRKQLEKIKANRGEANSLQRLEFHIKNLTKLRKQQNTQTENGIKRFKQLTNQLQQLKTKQKEYNDQVRATSTATKRSSKNLAANIKQFAAMYLSVFALVGIFKNITGIFVKFEKENSRLASILDTTKEGITVLSEDAKRLGAITAFTATEVTGLQIELAKLGFSQNEIKGSTEGILNLAAATGTDLARSAEIAGATIRAFNLDASEATRVADVFAKATSESALDMEKLGTAISIVAPVAANANVSLEKTTAQLGKLTDRGLDASTAATGLRNVYLELSKQGFTLEQAFEMINSASDKNAASLQLFGKRGATIGTILANTTIEVQKLDESLQGAAGTAQRMADTQLDNLTGSVTKMKSAWEGLVLSVEDGEGVFSSFFRGFVDRITEGLQALKELNTSVEDLARSVEEAGLNKFREDLKELSDEELQTRLQLTESAIERAKAANEEVKIIQFLSSQLTIIREQIAENAKAERIAEEQRIKTAQAAAELRAKEAEEKRKEKEKEAEEERKKNEKILKEQERFRKEFERENAKLLQNIKAQELKDFQDKQALDQSSFDLRIKQLRQQGQSEEDLAKEIKRFQITQAIETLEFLRITGEQQNATQIQLTRDLIAGLEIELQELNNIKKPKIQEILGLDDQQFAAAKQAASTFLNELGSILSAIAQTQIDAAQKRIDESDKRLEKLEDDRKSAEDRLARGEAANLDLIDQQIAEEKALRDKAEKDRQKAVKQQQALDTIAQVSSMITAVAQVIKGFSLIPIIGPALGIAAAIALVGAFTKLKIEQSRNLAEGEVMIDGKGTETSDSIPANLSKHESVIKAKSTKKSVRSLTNINDGVWSDKDILPAMELYNAFNPDNNITRHYNFQLPDRKVSDNSDINSKLLKENILLQKQILNRKSVIIDNGKIYEINHNTGMITVKSN